MIHLLNMLSTWRLMRLIQQDNAPFDMLERFRKQVHYDSLYLEDNPLKSRISKEIDNAIQCDWCLSFWTGLFVALVTRQNLVWSLAYSAGALFLSPLFTIVNRYSEEKNNGTINNRNSIKS